MEKMTKEQYAEIKRQFLEDKQRAYEAEPGVYRLIKTKRLLWRILAAGLVIHCALTIIASIQIQADINYLFEIVRTLFQLFWLYVFISPEGTWRLNIMLYISAAYNLITIAKQYQQYQAFSAGLFLQFLREMPVYGILFIMEVLLPFLFLGTAFYLTLPKAHRNQAERVQEIIKELQEAYKTDFLNNEGEAADE